MAIKPMLFNTEMVRAILSGQKTCTRRVVKGAEHYTSFIDLDDDLCVIQVDRYGIEREKPVTGLYATFEWDGMPEFPTVKAPYRPGDILYVREAFAPNYFSKEIADFYNNGNRTAYRADYDSSKIGDVVPEPKWRPSIHMPKEAARIFLRVTDVRVERLQEITEEDAFKEGFNGVPWCSHLVFENYPDSPIPCDASDGSECPPDRPCDRSIPELFGEMIWDSTIKPADLDRYGWTANPWVWVIEFERISKEAALGGKLNGKT